MTAVNRQFRNDANLELKDAGLVASSARAQVDSANQILDIGAGFCSGNVVIDVTAIEIASNDELYSIILQGSSSSTFASTIVSLQMIQVGAKEVLLPASGCDVDSTTGRYIFPFRNERDGTVYRYVSLYTVVAGTIATGGGINYSAFMAKDL